MGFLSLQSIIPPGTVLSYAGTSAPDGWLICNGSQVSRTTYNALFSVIGTSYGQGDNSTTFNLPDYRWTFLRGRGDYIWATGTGSADTVLNQATFTNHGLNRTGIKVTKAGGLYFLTPLSAGTEYYAIVVDSNTLAFATTKANAINNVRIALSGSNSAVIVQLEDPSVSSRAQNCPGGNTGASVGSYQENAFMSHWHLTGNSNGTTSTARPTSTASGGGTSISSSTTGGGYSLDRALDPTDRIDAGGTTRSPKSSDYETRPNNISVNYIIKV